MPPTSRRPSCKARSSPDEHHHEHATCFNVRDRGLGRHHVVRSCRDHQHDPAGTGGLGRGQAARAAGRLPSRAGTGPLHRPGRRRTEGYRSRTRSCRCTAAGSTLFRPSASRCRTGCSSPRQAPALPSARETKKRGAGASAERTRSWRGPFLAICCGRLCAGTRPTNWRRRAGCAFCRGAHGRVDVGAGADRRPLRADRPDRRPSTDADYHGKLALIYFGYTYCPDVCPTDLQAMASALDLLGDGAQAFSRSSSRSTRSATPRSISRTTFPCFIRASWA